MSHGGFAPVTEGVPGEGGPRRQCVLGQMGWDRFRLGTAYPALTPAQDTPPMASVLDDASWTPRCPRTYGLGQVLTQDCAPSTPSTPGPPQSWQWYPTC